MTSLWGGGGQYEQWASFLDRWSAGESVDPHALPPIRREDFAGDTMERLVTRVADALSARLQAWATALTKAMASPDEFTVEHALGSARHGLVPIRFVAGHPALPADISQRLVAMVDSQIRHMQQSLEDHIVQMRRDGVDRHLVERRLRTYRTVRLDAPVAGAHLPEPPAATSRRIVIT